MIDILPASLWFVALPLGASLLGLAVWSRPQLLKVWTLIGSAASLGCLMGLADQLPMPPEGLWLVYLLPITAFLSLLGQPRHQDNRSGWLMTLLLLGLGMGSMLSPDGMGRFLLALLLSLAGGMLYHYQRASGALAWWDLGTVGLGLLGTVVTQFSPSSMDMDARLMACAVLLPLFPLHRGFVGLLKNLPGNLPAFLTLLLPSLGFHHLLSIIPMLSPTTAAVVAILAVAGMLFGSLKALTQSRVRSLLAFAALAFLSVLWWYMVTTRTAPPAATVYLSAVCLASSGLFLAWHVLLSRYGKVDLRAISGLAHAMPRFATLMSLLALAALGLPPFGVFSGFLGLLLSPSLPLTGALCAVVLAWLTASWYFLELMQRLLFGLHRPELRYEDLRQSEFASLLLILAILVGLGLTPARFFTPSGVSAALSQSVMETTP